MNARRPSPAPMPHLRIGAKRRWICTPGRDPQRNAGVIDSAFRAGGHR